MTEKLPYVDGFLVAVPTSRKKDYIEIAEKTAVIFKEHGAIDVIECWGDDVPQGVLTSFPRALLLEATETAVFSWITWVSKAARDKGMDKFMADPRVKDFMPDNMPFDGKRMIFGGFQMVVRA